MALGLTAKPSGILCRVMASAMTKPSRSSSADRRRCTSAACLSSPDLRRALLTHSVHCSMCLPSLSICSHARRHHFLRKAGASRLSMVYLYVSVTHYKLSCSSLGRSQLTGWAECAAGGTRPAAARCPDARAGSHAGRRGLGWTAASSGACSSPQRCCAAMPRSGNLRDPAIASEVFRHITQSSCQALAQAAAAYARTAAAGPMGDVHWIPFASFELPVDFNGWLSPSLSVTAVASCSILDRL